MANSGAAIRPAVRSIAAKSAVFFWLGFWALFAKFFLQGIVLVEVDKIVLDVLLLFGCAFLGIRAVILPMEGQASGLGLVGICLGLLSYVLSGESVLLTTSLLLTAAYKIDIYTILRCWTRAVTAIIVLMLWAYIVSLFIGFTVGKTWIDIGGLSSIRGALFFSHPNYCAAVFSAWAMAMFCRRDTRWVMKLITAAIAMAVIIVIAGSRTSLVSLCIFFVVAAAFTSWRKRNGDSFTRWFSCIVVAVPLFLAVFTFWISAFWFPGPDFNQALSDFLTGRPALWWAQWDCAGLTLFGHHAFTGNVLIRGTVYDIHTVDGAYASFLFNIGIAGFIWLLVLAFRAFNHRNTTDPIWAAALIAIFVFGFTEWHAINAILFTPLIFLSQGVRSADREVSREF